MTTLKWRFLPVALAVGALVLVGACSSETGDPGSGLPAPATTVVPQDVDGAPVGFTAVTLVVTRVDGSTEEWCVWLADDQAERSRGLMFVTDAGLGGKDGMVFVFPEDSGAAFFMKNTKLPLSIAYIDGDGQVVSTTDMEPCPADTTDCPVYPADGPYRLALEVPVGELARLGVTEGSTVTVGARSC